MATLGRSVGREKGTDDARTNNSPFGWQSQRPWTGRNAHPTTAFVAIGHFATAPLRLRAVVVAHLWHHELASRGQELVVRFEIGRAQIFQSATRLAAPPSPRLETSVRGRTHDRVGRASPRARIRIQRERPFDQVCSWKWGHCPTGAWCTSDIEERGEANGDSA